MIMKKLMILAALVFAVLVSGINAQEEATKRKLPSEPEEAQKRKLTTEDTKPIAVEKPQARPAAKTAFEPIVSGVVVAVSRLAFHGDPTLNKADAMALAKEGQPLALKSGDNVYLIYNAKNVFDGKALANFADSKNIGIEGELKQIGGMNVVIAKKIQPID